MRTRTIHFVVDDREIEVARGRMLLHVLREQGIRLPTLCHDDRLTPYGGCRLCVVDRLDGKQGLVPACSTPVEEGMLIRTETPEVIESRRRQIQLILLDHRLECPVCCRNGDCRLQDLIYEIGVPDDDLPFRHDPPPPDDRSPVIVRDPGKCVLCGRCVRLCEEVQGIAAIGFEDRGLGLHVATFADRELDCEFCGQCVNACPVAALTVRSDAARVPVWLRSRVATTCGFCSCGCELMVESDEGRLQRVTGSPESSPNQGKLCVKGWLGLDLLASDERLTRPMVRRDGRLTEVDWSEALDSAAAGLREAGEKGRMVVGLGGGRLSCEDGYLLQRFVRGSLGSPHVASDPVGGSQALVDGLGPVLNRPRSTGSYGSLAGADVVIVLRADPTRTHPLVKTEIVQGVQQRGQRLALVHSLSGGLERQAELDLRVEPGSEADLICGLSLQLLRARPTLENRIRDIAGADGWRESLDPYTVDLVCRRTGVDTEVFDRLLRLLLEARRPQLVLVSGVGVPGDEAAAARAAIQMTSLLSGSPGVLVLGEKANVQGLVDVGLHPDLLPGHRPVSDPAMRDEVADLTGVRPPAGPGLTARGAFSAAAGGEVGAMLLMGLDPVRSLARGYEARAALEGAGFIICLDPFFTDSARCADVVLPAAILAEREGSVVGHDGVRRRLRRALPAPAGLPGDGEILNQLAIRLGSTLPFGDDLEEEMQRVVGWPFATATLDRLLPVDPPGDRIGWSGILLDGSPQLFHSGSVTTRSNKLCELSPPVAVRLNPTDALDLGVSGGEVVSVASGDRELLLKARIDPTVRRSTVVVLWGAGRDGASELMTEDGKPVPVRLRGSR